MNRDRCRHLRSDIIADYVVWCRDCGAYKIQKAGIDWVRPINAISVKEPLPQLKDTFPVVLYFGSAKDADEFVEVVKLEKPNLVARPL